MADHDRLRTLHPERVPTLTEVVEFDPRPDARAAHSLPMPMPMPALSSATTPPPPTPPLASPSAADIDAAQLAGQLWSDIAPQLDALVEARLRGALVSALASAVDGALADTRQALALAMREWVDGAVKQALRQRAIHSPAAGDPTPQAPGQPIAIVPR